MKFTPSWVTASDGSLVVYIQTLCSLAFVLGGLRSSLQAFMVKAEHALALVAETEKRETGTAGRTGTAVCRFG